MQYIRLIICTAVTVRGSITIGSLLGNTAIRVHEDVAAQRAHVTELWNQCQDGFRPYVWIEVRIKHRAAALEVDVPVAACGNRPLTVS